MRAGLWPLSASRSTSKISPSMRVVRPAFGDVDLLAARDDPLVWIKPDKGVAAHLLAALHRLQQKAFALLPRRAQKGRNRRLQVGRERAKDGDKRVLFGERQKILAAGLDQIRGRPSQHPV